MFGKNYAKHRCIQFLCWRLSQGWQVHGWQTQRSPAGRIVSLPLMFLFGMTQDDFFRITRWKFVTLLWKIDHIHRLYRLFMYLFKTEIFHSYVKLPEGTLAYFLLLEHLTVRFNASEILRINSWLSGCKIRTLLLKSNLPMEEWMFFFKIMFTTTETIWSYGIFIEW